MGRGKPCHAPSPVTGVKGEDPTSRKPSWITLSFRILLIGIDAALSESRALHNVILYIIYKLANLFKKGLKWELIVGFWMYLSKELLKFAKDFPL